MNDANWETIMAGFSKQFRAEEIGKAPGNKGGGDYVDARSIAERLDEVVNPGNWSVSYRVIDLAAGVVEATLTVYGISKADVGYPNNTMGTLNNSGKLLEPEPMKAAYSDALKRAAVQWGIGRYLYPYASKRQREGGDAEQTERPSGRANPPATPPQAPPATNGHYAAQDGDFEPSASPYKPASANQLAVIAKLSKLIGHPEDPREGMSAAEASDRVTELSRIYNGRKGGATRETPDHAAPSTEQRKPTEQQWNKMWAIHKTLEEKGVEHPRVPAKEPYLARWSYEQGEEYIARLDDAQKAAGISR